MKIKGRITNAKYRKGTKQNSGEPWECVDYYLVEVDAQSHRSEFPFSIFNAKMREWQLHLNAEGEFDVQVTNEVRNGYNNIRVYVNGFAGVDNGQEKRLGSYAEPGAAQNGVEPGAAQQQATAAQPKVVGVTQPNSAAFDPNGGFGQSSQAENLPF